MTQSNSIKDCHEFSLFQPTLRWYAKSWCNSWFCPFRPVYLALFILNLWPADNNKCKVLNARGTNKVLNGDWASIRLSFNKCKVSNARGTNKVLNSDWASIRLSFNKCKVLNARDARKVLNGDWASGKRCRRRLPGGVQSHELTAIWMIFLSLSIFSIFGRQCGRESGGPEGHGYGWMNRFKNGQLGMVDGRAQGGGGDWKGTKKIFFDFFHS